MFQPSDTEMGAHSLAARVAVRDERPLEQRPHIIAQQVVHDTVAEVGRKDFPFDRDVGHETDAAAHTVAPFGDFVVEVHQILFEVHLEAQLAQGVPFVFAGVVICLENVGQ